jgi:hypothetical protein
MEALLQRSCSKLKAVMGQLLMQQVTRMAGKLCGAEASNFLSCSMLCTHDPKKTG